ncbi:MULTISPECIES: hypothetical protein [Roseobacteraceae]|nr:MULTISPECIES: hypothetical protein [Roseobacteraceae]MBT3140027.1 hypothetical protein [Falsiruegeria litorea]MBT8167174.1 hypothetical protein [Falsiruegeria litorea]
MKNVITACVSAAMLVSSTTFAFSAVDEQAMKDARERNICEKYAKQNNKVLGILVSAEYKVHNGVNTLYVKCSDDNVAGAGLAGLGTGGAVALGAGVLLLAAVLGDDDEAVTTTTTTSN